MPALIVETIEYKEFLPVSRTKCLWDITCGIYNPRQRCSKLLSGIFFHTPRFTEKPFSLLKNDYSSSECYEPGTFIDAIISAQFIPSGDYNKNINTLCITPEGSFISLFSDAIQPDIIESIENNDCGALFSRYK